MWDGVKFRSTDGSGSLAAAFVVISTGLFGLAACTLLFVNDEPLGPLLLLGGYFASALFFLWLLSGRGELPSVRHFIFRGRANNAVVKYEPKLVRQRPASYGTNHPPSAEEIRDLSDGLRNWVPSKHARPRSTPRSPRPD